MISATLRSSVSEEFAEAELGDSRRSERMIVIVDKLSRDPSASFPTVLDSSAELEAFYRFVNNDGFDASDVLTPHVEATLSRAQTVGEIVVVHDTTTFDYSGLSRRDGLGATSGKASQGFVAHAAFAMSADDARMPLGLLHLETYTRTGKKNGKRSKSPLAARSDEERESLRWCRGVEAVEELSAKSFGVIHVMDAEADFFELLARMTSDGARFVVRGGQLDRTVAGKVAEQSLREALNGLRPKSWREIELSERKDRGRQRPRDRKRRHPPRNARVARVAIAGMQIRIPRTRYCNVQVEDIPLNVVRVWEAAPPQGESRVEWVLFTREPVSSAKDVERVVDLYRQRWMIEEFFKALKTGCAIEKRQLESYDALCKVLALFLPIAYRLLLVRSVERKQPDAPATLAFTRIELDLLAHAPATRGLSPPATIADALLLVARLGGHLKHNGRPGWQTLARGYEKLLTYRLGYEIAQGPTSNRTRERSDQ